MARTFPLLCLVVALVSLRAAGQTTTATNPDEGLTQRILAGDLNAISEAGASGNRVFVPYLRRELQDPRYKDDSRSPIPVARAALAKLGELDQLQELWCLSISEDAYSGIFGPRPVGTFGFVGGWYAYQALQKFLLPDGDVHFARAYKKHKAKYPHDL